MALTIEQIRSEIESHFGFSPQYHPQDLLRNQGRSLPLILKLRVSTLLALDSKSTYTVARSLAGLTEIGETINQIEDLLKLPRKNLSELKNSPTFIQSLTLTEWPASRTSLEIGLLSIARLTNVNECSTEAYQLLRKTLAPNLYEDFVSLLASIRGMHSWLDSHPEMSLEADPILKQTVTGLTDQTPSLRSILFRDVESRSEIETVNLPRYEVEQYKQLLEAERKARLRAEGSERRFRTFANFNPQPLWTANARGLIDFANEAWSDYTGMSREQIANLCWLDAIHPDDLAQVRSEWERAASACEPFECEFRIRRHDGIFHWFLTRGTPVLDPEMGQIKWYGSSTEIDSRKKLEVELKSARLAAENANLTKASFLANMSHEIRTPLGAILGFTELLKDSSLKPNEVDQYLGIISRNGQALAGLINDILDLSKAEASQMVFSDVEFSLTQLVRQVMGIFVEKANSKNLALDLEVDPLTPELISSDPLRLRQILMNVIGNAVKFTLRGKIKVHVSSALRPGSTNPDDLLCTVTVEDTGPGLSREQRKLIFHPFTQADNTSTRRFGGTGLGLALAQKLARGLKGDVTLISNEFYRGSIFATTFEAKRVRTEVNTTLNQQKSVWLQNSSGSPTQSSLPAREKQALPIELASTRSTSAGPKLKRLQGIRILLVEDSEDNQIFISLLLERNGAQVEVASNGVEGVDKALRGTFDVVLMDIQMPRMDGVQATTVLRKEGYDKPVLALTAHALQEDRIKSREAGCNSHLTKPIDPENLLSTIERFATITAIH